jgi:hypothetical protein
VCAFACARLPVCIDCVLIFSIRFLKKKEIKKVLSGRIMFFLSNKVINYLVGYVAAEDLEIWVFETYFVEIDAVEIDLHLQDDDRRLVKRSYIDVLRCE